MTTKYLRRGRSVSAIMREDGTVYFHVQPSRPIIERVLEWGTALLWFFAFAILIASLI